MYHMLGAVDLYLNMLLDYYQYSTSINAIFIIIFGLLVLTFPYSTAENPKGMNIFSKSN